MKPIYPHKLANILQLPERERYEYSIREIVKFGMVWTVSKGEGWMTMVDETGTEILPIWPHEEVAVLCLLTEMRDDGGGIEAMSLPEFLEDLLPMMADAGVQMGVFYNLERRAWAVQAVKLLDDLNRELREYED